MLFQVFGNSSLTEMNRNWASNTVGGLQITVLNFNSDLLVQLGFIIGGIKEINRGFDPSSGIFVKTGCARAHVQNWRHIHILCLMGQPI